MGKTQKTLFLIILIGIGIYANVISSAVTPGPNDIITDQKCIHYLLTHEGDECNRQCSRRCVEYMNRPCNYGDPNACSATLVWGANGELELSGELIIIDEDLEKYFNIAGINLGPIDQALPRLIRIVLFGAFSFIGASALGYGIYGMIVVSTASDSAEKFETGMKIFKNAVLGVIMSFGGLLIVQLAALFTGMESDLFSFYLIPKQGTIVDISDDFYENGICLPGQQGITPDGATHLCDEVEGKWL